LRLVEGAVDDLEADFLEALEVQVVGRVHDVLKLGFVLQVLEGLEEFEGLCIDVALQLAGEQRLLDRD